MSDVTWRLQKLKERQERIKQREKDGDVTPKAAKQINRNSDSNIDYSPKETGEEIVETYTNPNPVCKYSPLYAAQESNVNGPSFARRHSDFSTSSSSRNSVYSEGSAGSISGSYSSQSTSNVQNLINQREASTTKRRSIQTKEFSEPTVRVATLKAEIP